MKSLDWPSRNPNLNPIEMLWHHLETAVHVQNPPMWIMTNDGKMSWPHFLHSCKKLIASYSNCLISAVAGKSGPSSY